MTTMPMFPLGTVLFPAMPAMLRVFEERYLVMLATVLQQEPPEFGIVLIERGAEVGGGDGRFGIGTIAQITQLMEGEGFVGLAATGSRRVEVVEWLEDDPYPQAEVRVLPDLVWDEELRSLLEETEHTVRRALAQGSEFVEQQWSSDVELSDDPVEAAWQLAAVSPVGDLDQIALLRAESVEALLRLTSELTIAASDALTANWSDSPDLEFPSDELGQ